MSDKPTGLDLMRAPFPDHQIGKLAKGSKAQTQCAANEKVNCAICGGWHHPKMIHLDYVGHAALTDRLLDCDPSWSWGPLALKDGLPAFDEDGGLWIRLTVCGVTRLGYGNAADSEYKEIGSRQKEVIGDALRNAAMRFGAALELWHKGDLHVEEPTAPTTPRPPPAGSAAEAKAEALASLDSEAAAYIRELAGEVEGITDPQAQADKYYQTILDTTERVALWGLLGSKTRTSIKKLKREQPKDMPSAIDLAGQA